MRRSSLAWIAIIDKMNREKAMAAPGRPETIYPRVFRRRFEENAGA